MPDPIKQTPDNGGAADNSKQFLHLFLANHSKIYSYILCKTPNWIDADDILQETSIILWQKFDSFEPGTNFAAWAIKVARYKIMNFQKKKCGRYIQYSESMLKKIEERMDSRAAENNDSCLNALQGCVKKLRDRDRELIRLRYERGCVIDKLADQVGISSRALYKNMARIHDGLLRCIRITLANEDRGYE